MIGSGMRPRTLWERGHICTSVMGRKVSCLKVPGNLAMLENHGNEYLHYEVAAHPVFLAAYMSHAVIATQSSIAQEACMHFQINHMGFTLHVHLPLKLSSHSGVRRTTGTSWPPSRTNTCSSTTAATTTPGRATAAPPSTPGAVAAAHFLQIYDSKKNQGLLW